MNQDQVTELLRKSINILFVSNPKGTSIGILLGVISDGVLGLFAPVLKAIKLIDIAAIKLWHLVALGVVAINLPTYLQRKKIDPSIIEAIKFIEDGKKSKRLSPAQASLEYAALYRKVLDKVVINPDVPHHNQKQEG